MGSCFRVSAHAFSEKIRLSSAFLYPEASGHGLSSIIYEFPEPFSAQERAKDEPTRVLYLFMKNQGFPDLQILFYGLDKNSENQRLVLASGGFHRTAARLLSASGRSCPPPAAPSCPAIAFGDGGSFYPPFLWRVSDGGSSALFTMLRPPCAMHYAIWKVLD